jgi:molybdate transport system regulatory protein
MFASSPSVVVAKTQRFQASCALKGAALISQNQLKGTVSGFVRGAVNCQVNVALSGGAAASAMITNQAAADMGLVEGTPVIALFKASHVLIGVPV